MNLSDNKVCELISKAIAGNDQANEILWMWARKARIEEPSFNCRARFIIYDNLQNGFEASDGV